MDQFILNFDSSILLWIQDCIRNPILNPVFALITHLGDAGIFWIALSVILCIPKKTRKAGVAGLIALIFSVLINNVFLKNVVGRIRPYEIIEDLELLTIMGIKKAHDASFPSGHTGASIAAAVAYIKYLPKKFWIPGLVLAILISLSRLYIGIHYPTDVIAGAIIGAALGVLAGIILDFVLKKWNEKHPKKEVN